ncbi:hypothetical protein CEV34_0511 [Brucella pseudogrignonensis]|jgi:hypothetical protein|uniref:Uncharacterized protein n=1 Tax=Brucella pseudogrignonensis TaxID=419475 RepID=A0A256GSJ9_9HYPH|nr:hypothetical protein CEV34_0511 [Brucella pseudogrignonensis]
MNDLRRQEHTIRHRFATVRIVAALAALCVQKCTGNSRPVDFLSVVIQQFMQAALTASIAQAFPFLSVELL